MIHYAQEKITKQKISVHTRNKLKNVGSKGVNKAIMKKDILHIREH